MPGHSHLSRCSSQRRRLDAIRVLHQICHQHIHQKFSCQMAGMDDDPILLQLDKLLLTKDTALCSQRLVAFCQPGSNHPLPLLQELCCLLNVLLLPVIFRPFLPHCSIRLHFQRVIGMEGSSVLRRNITKLSRRSIRSQ